MGFLLFETPHIFSPFPMIPNAYPLGIMVMHIFMLDKAFSHNLHCNIPVKLGKAFSRRL
jgi:hypothetical protein